MYNNDMRTLLKFLLLVIVVTILAGVAFAAYLGFVPGLSKYFGIAKPKDLGVTYSKQDYDTYLKKAGFTVETVKEPKNGKSIEFSGKSAVSQTFSQEEISGRLNYSQWKYMLISNTQIRINNDGTVEMSANLNTDKLTGFIQAVGGGSYSGEEIEKAKGILNKLPPNLPVYAKFTAEVKNNKADISVQALQIGHFTIPLDKIGGDAAVEAVTDHIFEIVPGFYAEQVSFSDGKMQFKGSAPNKVLVQTD